MSKKLLNFLLFFLSFSLIFQIFFSDNDKQVIDPNTPLVITSAKNQYSKGKVVNINIHNNTTKTYKIQNTCPTEPLTVVKVTNGKYTQVNATPFIDCRDSIDPATKDIVLKPMKNTNIRYTLWSNTLFEELGRYKVIGTFNIDGKANKFESNEFEIVEPGFFGKIWVSALYQPIYNFLIYLINISPAYSLGIAIILLTVIVRLILYVPNQRALVAQKKMAEVQPKLNEIREKYKNNQELMAAETMKIWKENKVNPLGGCLPLLIQFPVLIALFYVIQDGLNPDKIYLLYEPLKNFDFTKIEIDFLWMHLTSKDLFILPLIVGGLQYLQLKLATLGKDPNAKVAPEMEMTQNMMMYVMPAMIAVFTATLPSGVGIYWGTSTFIGIIQQIFVNKSRNKHKHKTENHKKSKKK